jgi:hypothetical protein
MVYCGEGKVEFHLNIAFYIFVTKYWMLAFYTSLQIFVKYKICLDSIYCLQHKHKHTHTHRQTYTHTHTLLEDWKNGITEFCYSEFKLPKWNSSQPCLPSFFNPA